MIKQNYTYTICQIDIPNSMMLVKYVPENQALTSCDWNIAAYHTKPDGSLMTIDECIDHCAPHMLWAAQKALINNYQQLLNKTAKVTFNE